MSKRNYTTYSLPIGDWETGKLVARCLEVVEALNKWGLSDCLMPYRKSLTKLEISHSLSKLCN